MTTKVILKGNPDSTIFSIDESLPLNIGDIFSYKAAEPNERIIESALFQIKRFEESQKYKARNIEGKMTISRTHFEKWGAGVKFIIVNKEVSIYRSSDFLQDDVIKSSVFLYVEVYDESYIRNKKLEQIL